MTCLHTCCSLCSNASSTLSLHLSPSVRSFPPPTSLCKEGGRSLQMSNCFFFCHGQVFHTPPGIQFVWWRLQPGCFCRARHVRTQDGSARRATDGAFRQRGVLALILGGRCWATPLEKKARRNKVSVQRRFTGGWQWCAACRFSSEEQLMSKLGCSFVGFLPTHLS